MIDTKQRAKDILEDYANYYSQADLQSLANIVLYMLSVVANMETEKGGVSGDGNL